LEKKESAATIFWHRHAVTKEDRQRLHGHKSLMVWLTGLSGSGKSTIANAVLLELFNKGISAYLLDGDNLRHGLNSNLSFSPEDRKENIRRTAETGKLFVDAGIVVLSALISPFREDRLNARTILGEENFIEVYIKCPLEECEKRDFKDEKPVSISYSSIDTYKTCPFRYKMIYEYGFVFSPVRI